MFAHFTARIRTLFRRSSFERDMQEEMRFHLEQYAADLTASGVPKNEALRRARLEFGDSNSVQEDCRQARGLRIVDEAARDIRHAARLLRKSPGFTCAALVTLAVCLGANLSIFAVVDAILLRPLPFPDSARLITMYNSYPKAGVERDGSSLPNYYERRGTIPALQSLSMYRYGTNIVGQPGHAERLETMDVSPEFFATLGTGPQQGRAFTEAETSFDNSGVAILAERYCRVHLGGCGNVVGRQIRVNGRPVTVVGILPANFHFLSSQAQILFPLASDPQARASSARHAGGDVLQIVARLRPHATLAEAQAEIDAQNNSLERFDPQAKMIADAGFCTLLVPLHQDHVASVKTVLLALQLGVLLLLLIGTVNLANLLLVRAHARAKEFAVRQALGASRLQLIREAVVETTLLTTLGGGLGVLAALEGIHLLSGLGADRLPLGSYVTFDARIASAAFCSALLLALLLTVPLAWFASSQKVHSVLKADGRTSTSGYTAQRLRQAFTVAQVGLSFILLVGAGLLASALKNATSVSPGFEAGQVLTGAVTLTGENYPSAASGLAFSERLVHHLSQQPGVLAAGIVNNLPFSGRNGKSAASVVGYSVRPGESVRGNYAYGVAGYYFQAMGFTLVEGRFLNGVDSRRSQRVCVVDSDFAQHYWPHRSPLGQRLFQGSSYGRPEEAFTVVGVVRAAKQAGLTEDAAQGAVYYPYIYRPDNHLFAAVRSSANPELLARSLQSSVRAIDPELSVDDLKPMTVRISDSLVTQRSPALLAVFFASIALLLTASGTYGVLSYAVVQRRREIGIRLALGARPSQIRTQFLLLSMRLLAAGAAIGVIGSAWAGHALQKVLFHVRAFDPRTIGITAAVLLAVSVLACLLPAFRACRISPREVMLEV